MRFGGLIAAIVLAAVAAVIVLRMSGGNDAPAPQPGDTAAAQPVQTTNIYVAAQPIAVGTTVTADMIAVQAWPSHLVLDGFVTTDSDQKIEGMISRAPFQQQEPILLSKLSNMNDPNFLAGSIPKGMRVISIQTNEIEGVAGFVFPGDFVDVILTHDIKKWVFPPSNDQGRPEGREETDSVTETLLTNAKVVAVDQRASGAGATDEQGNLIVPRSVSLMVSPADAQRLRLGQQKGTLTLALRSLADRETADPLTVTGNKDISQVPEFGTTGGASGNTGGVLVVRGTEAGESESESAAPLDAAAADALLQSPNAPVAQ